MDSKAELIKYYTMLIILCSHIQIQLFSYAFRSLVIQLMTDLYIQKWDCRRKYYF